MDKTWIKSDNSVLDNIFASGLSSQTLNVIIGVRSVGKSYFPYHTVLIKNQILKRNRKQKLYDFITNEYQYC